MSTSPSPSPRPRPRLLVLPGPLPREQEGGVGNSPWSCMSMSRGGVIVIVRETLRKTAILGAVPVSPAPVPPTRSVLYGPAPRAPHIVSAEVEDMAEGAPGGAFCESCATAEHRQQQQQQQQNIAYREQTQTRHRPGRVDSSPPLRMASPSDCAAVRPANAVTTRLVRRHCNTAALTGVDTAPRTRGAADGRCEN